MDRYVQNYVRRVDRNKMSDYDLAKKVHDDVCRATVYDMEMDSRYDDYDFSAYGCLNVGRCVCQGYALAYYRLCRELGLSVRFVYSDPHEAATPGTWYRWAANTIMWTALGTIPTMKAISFITSS